MDPSRPLLGRGGFLPSSAHAVAAMALIAFLLLTLLRLPLSLSISIYTPPPPLAVADQHHHQEDQEQQDDSSSCDLSSPLDCADPRLFHLMMRSAIDAFPAVHFARFGRPVPGDPPSASCDTGLALTLRLPHGHHQGYRRFAIANSLELTLCLAAT
jgi:hypothetical protein